MVETVFCIDDDPITLMLCEKVFNKTAFCKTTVKALNGELALNYYQSLLLTKNNQTPVPQLIFLDLNMPITNGWQFLQAFKKDFFQHFPLTKVIILSSSLNPNDKDIMKEYDLIIDFIIKPLTIESIEHLKLQSEISQFFNNGI